MCLKISLGNTSSSLSSIFATRVSEPSTVLRKLLSLQTIDPASLTLLLRAIEYAERTTKKHLCSLSSIFVQQRCFFI